MNTQFRSPTLPQTTQAAEGLMRRRWSVAEIEAMVQAGVIEEDERFELIGGEVVPMSPKGNRHELLKVGLLDFWVRRLPEDLRIAPETTFRLNEDTFLEPDFVFYRTADGLVTLRPETTLLAVEISDSSLGYDLGRKARLYAAFGISELWVIDAVKLICHRHCRPGIEGYEDKQTIAADGTLTPGFAPELAVSLASLQLV